MFNFLIQKIYKKPWKELTPTQKDYFKKWLYTLAFPIWGIPFTVIGILFILPIGIYEGLKWREFRKNIAWKHRFLS